MVDRYSTDVLTTDWRAPKNGRAVPAPAEIGAVVEEVQTDFVGEIVAVDRQLGTVTLEDRRMKRRVFELGPGFLLEGKPVILTAPVAKAAAPAGPALAPSLWLWSEVRSGVATLTTPVVEAFVPQMLNYESVGGVNFKKGCYPGQEVVARSQFRGTLKRRAYLVHADALLEAGTEVFSTRW